MTEPRIDALPSAAILTDTQIRLTFAPADPDAKLTAMKLDVRKAKIDAMLPMLMHGKVHLQIKEGFGVERSIVLNPPEVMILMEMLDRFVTELPS